MFSFRVGLVTFKLPLFQLFLGFAVFALAGQYLLLQLDILKIIRKGKCQVNYELLRALRVSKINGKSKGYVPSNELILLKLMYEHFHVTRLEFHEMITKNNL